MGKDKIQFCILFYSYGIIQPLCFSYIFCDNTNPFILMNFFWKHSRLRFYILNTLWNYKFWLLAKKMYRTVTHSVAKTDDYSMDYTFKLKPAHKTLTSKRFSGYLFQGRIYHDNPGIQGIDPETWQAWKKKGLID